MQLHLQESEKPKLRRYFEQRIGEYQQDLCEEGLSSQQYDILRGRIKELQDLMFTLSLKEKEGQL